MHEPPRLAPPGAGLPPLEGLFARAGFHVLRAMLGRNRIRAWLCAETKRVLALARSLPEAQLRQRILIPRLAGLEDSSRYWSAAMVLQHLVIVDTGIGQLVQALCDYREFGREVRIAEVKPAPEAGSEQFARLEAALATYLDIEGGIARLNRSGRHAHPWFGELDGHGWHTLAALHTLIHRRQLESIVQRLPAAVS